jgi:capsular polysaccharide export protein
VYVDGGAVATALSEKRNLGLSQRSEANVSRTLSARKNIGLATAGGGSFLRVPPFPRTKLHAFAVSAGPQVSAKRDADDLISLLRAQKVGGSYWASQPELPGRYILVLTVDALPAARQLNGDPVVLWTHVVRPSDHPDVVVVTCDADPWHMVAGASAVVTTELDEVSTIAAIVEAPVYQAQAHSRSTKRIALDLAEILGDAFAADYENPFTGEPMGARELIELCGFWRQLIDSNRDLAGGIGFAFWKQDHVAPLLWGGTGNFPFFRSAREITTKAPVAIWRSKTDDDQIESMLAGGSALVEVEDGFLRSQGLGADCVPPLSITVDRHGAHFDPSRPSELELLLEKGAFDDATLGRARRVRELIVEAGLGKYERGGGRLDRPRGDRRLILVPGQVEDDRAVLSGGCGLTSNLDLLARVRKQAPEARILYKPHPDVLAGHRRGSIPEELCLRHADEIVGGAISSLIDVVDEVHVNTSLAGFEALLRGKLVTTYGVPFYAGWGLTGDLGPVPSRRTARRTLDELVAAALLVYPRYLDPVTGLPCPAEVIVKRLSSNLGDHPGWLVLMRRFQGRLLRSFRSVVQ